MMFHGGHVGFGFMLLPLIGAVLIGWLLYRALSGRDETNRTEDEARMLQEMYQSLTRLEKRVQSLETLLNDQERDHE